MSPTFRFLSHILTAHVDPHVYPHFNLYPARAAELASREEDTSNDKLFLSSITYPILVICEFYFSVFLTPLLTEYVDPHVYPHFNLYPARAAEVVTREESKMFNATASSYPYLVICTSSSILQELPILISSRSTCVSPFRSIPRYPPES